MAGTALLANTERRGAFFQNDADRACYLKFGSGVSSSSYTVKMNPKDPDGVGGTFDLGSLRALYTGRIDAVWDAGVSGALRITELTG